MKIKSIDIKNFRQFKDKRTIDFDIDGKITVILGDNGTGKTTLLQFFNWVFYGNYYFDNDINGKLYNFESDLDYSYGTVFSVEGTVTFAHDGHDYRLTRTKQYKKAHNDSKEDGGHVSLLYCDELGNWKPYADVERRINEILPRALSRYFFFDGERKISDFNVKSGDSLEKAIFSMFNIDVIKNACDHIGEISTSISLLGKIAKLKTASKSGLAKKSFEYLKMTQAYNDQAESYKRKVAKDEDEKKRINDLISEYDQKIGLAKGTKTLEKARIDNERSILSTKNRVLQNKSIFGKSLYKSAPYLLLSEKAIIATSMLQPKAKEQKEFFFEELRKGLIRDVLIKQECICGRKIDSHSIAHLNLILDTMPPNSFKSIFYDFKKKAYRYISSAEQEIELAKGSLADIAECNALISQLELSNKELVNQMKWASDIQKDIQSREALKNKVNDIQKRIDFNALQMNQALKNKDTARKYFEKASASEGSIGTYEKHIHIAKLTKIYFESVLKDKIIKSKENLESNIRDVYNQVSTTERKHVYLNSDYTLVVKNDDNSTYKSGGQDIIIMYSYIGGILKTLQKLGLEKEGKEYPLIIDAPFSKVDGSQLGSVTEALSRVAPQVVLMTFDSDRLDTRANKDFFGKIWRIDSNATKTVSTIEVHSL